MLGTKSIYWFSSSCDMVRGKEMWSEMNKLGFPAPKLIKLCKIWNNKIYAKFKISKNTSPKFKFNKRLKQEDAVAPLLFNMVWKSQFVAIK
jgi:hypothetical protein